MRPHSFLLLVLICFVAMSCLSEEKFPPNVTGTWAAVSLETFNMDKDGWIYNETYQTFWEDEKILILYSDNTWREIRETASYSGTWELHYVSSSVYDWRLVLKQNVASKYFWINRIDRNELVLEEVNNSFHSITTYVAVK